MFSAVALVFLLAVVFALVVLAFGRMPEGAERTLLALSVTGGAVVALLYPPLRLRLVRVGQGEGGAAKEVLRTFSTRMTRALPLDELLLQLVEALRPGLALEAAEVWTGSEGSLQRVASVPERAPAALRLESAEQSVLSRAGVSGPAWLRVWLPQLLEGREERPLRIAPITSRGELYGLIVAERGDPAGEFDEEDERVLGDLARQVGLALRNARLDSELEASLEELRRQAAELRASRNRIVSAADAERRRIERDLHDGAQQHLVGLAVHLRLARDLADSDPTKVRGMLEELGDDVQGALEQLRDLAHGIYPPLLQDRGLSDALAAACGRAPVRARSTTDGIGRYDAELEATIYFCCLEALQNVAKHAGPAATATVHVREESGALHFDVADDGIGFSVDRAREGVGLTNMRDRVGAVGGKLRVESASGRGTTVAGIIPLEARR